MASRPHINGKVTAVLADKDCDGGYAVIVMPDDLMGGTCDECDSTDMSGVTLRFSADETAARRYRVGDKIEVVAFKRSTREEPKQ